MIDPIPSRTTITYDFICCVPECCRLHSRDHTIDSDQCAQPAEWPEGWFLLCQDKYTRYWFCPEHHIALEIDRKRSEKTLNSDKWSPLALIQT